MAPSRRRPGQGARRRRGSRRASLSPARIPVLLEACTWLGAVALRWWYVDSVRQAPFFQHLQTNSLRYHQWATLILGGSEVPTPPFDQPPGYAYLLAFLYTWLAPGLESVARVQGLLDALTCACIAHVACHWFGWRAGVAAGILAVVCGPFLYFSAEMLPATISLSCLVVALTLTVHRRWLGAGLVWALGLTLRSELLFALPLVAIDAVRRGGRRAALRGLSPSLVLVALSLAANAYAVGHFVPLTIGGGLNLWLGNNPRADGVSPFVTGELLQEARQVRTQAGGDSVVADRLFAGRALRFWMEDPGDAVSLLAKKLVWTLSRRELPNTSDIDWQIGHSGMFALGFPWIGMGILLPLGLAGAIHAKREGGVPLLAAVPLVVGGLTCALFFTNARFRLPLLPSLIWLAAPWLGEISRWRSVRPSALPLAGLALGALLAWGNFHAVDDYALAPIEVNTGILEREAGLLPAASKHLRRGLELDPTDGLAWIHLALALEQMGLVADAVDAYLEGLRLAPATEDLENMTRRCFLRNGIDPQLLDDFLNRAAADQRREAVDAIRAAVRRAVGGG